MKRPAATLIPTFTGVLIWLGVCACGQSRITGGGSGGADIDAGPPPSYIDASAECGCTNCNVDEIGIGTSSPFDIVVDPSEFVGTDSEGALVVDKSNSTFNKYLWVADTNLPGVVKIDLDTFQIVGRYITGGSSTSRTTVNVRGEAFVGARAGGATGPGVTKVLPYGQDCPDTNGDGVITTSTGVNDVLPYGQDDCVVWHTVTEGDIRGLAAQDIPGTHAGDACGAGDDTPVEIPEQHYVWIGGLHGKIYKLNADTGEILLKVTAPAGVYGGALDGEGRFWTGSQLAFLDTTQCTDQATCEAAPVCSVSCDTNNCPDTCDGAVKAVINGVSGYGITVDCENRVWMSSGATKRYDPFAPVNQRLALGPNSGSGGIAADAAGWVWAATNGPQTIRIDSDTLEGTSISAPAKGVAVDSMGRILSVYNTGVHLIEPGVTLDAYTLTNDVTALAGFAYAYSDMTGVQTRLASGGPGWYRHIFEGCEDMEETFWRTLEWDVDAPDDTWTMFYARSADTLDALDQEMWQPVVTCVDGPGCSNAAAFTDLKGKYIELEIRLTAIDLEEGDGPKGCSQAVGESVRVRKVRVSHDCSAPLG